MIYINCLIVFSSLSVFWYYIGKKSGFVECHDLYKKLDIVNWDIFNGEKHDRRSDN